MYSCLKCNFHQMMVLEGIIFVSVLLSLWTEPLSFKVLFSLPYYRWKIIRECVSTVWHAASLNTSAIKHTHAGKQAFSDQSQCAAGIVVKVMFFDAQRSWSSTDSVRVHELLSISNSALLSSVDYSLFLMSVYLLLRLR